MFRAKNTIPPTYTYNLKLKFLTKASNLENQPPRMNIRASFSPLKEIEL